MGRTEIQPRNIEWIRISLASPEDILRWSKRKGPGDTEYYAEVKKAETFNYRTYRPERDGLFCERIFGPTKNYECACGKYKRRRFKEVVCDRCGVMVTHSKVRREWMAHIRLAAPVAHIWFTRSIPNRMSALLGINSKEVEKIVYYVQYIVTKIDIPWLLDHYRQIEAWVREHVRRLRQERRNVKNVHQMNLWEKLARFTTDDAQKRELAHGLAKKYGDGKLKPGMDFSQDPEVAEDLERMKDFVNREKILSFYRLAERIVDPATQEIIGQRGDEFTYALISKLFDAGFFVFLVEDKNPDLIRRKTIEELDYNISRLEGGIKLLRRLKKWALVPDHDTVTRGGRVAIPGYESFAVLRHLLYREYNIDLDNYIQLKMGAEALLDIFENLDLEELEQDLREEIERTRSAQTRRKLLKRLRIVRSFRRSGNRPEWMILKVLPVLPPELRPMVELDGGRFASSDLNELYRRVINRNNRLRKLIDIRSPESIMRNEKRMLQESVDALIDNARARGRPSLSAASRPLKSLSDMLRGKQGRFRQNLLGKRVDYSGRSVIVVGPSLKLHQCGLPKMMALELFKPFVLHKLINPDDPQQNVAYARHMVEKAQDEAVWDALDEIIKNHPVLLNRAPTLHRLSIQAFEPVLIEGKAIQLHPLVCTAYNADFDGDQMAVHVPLSTAAQAEARVLMLSSNNLLLPADGRPIVGPTQDMVLGIYYLSQVLPDSRYTEPIDPGDLSKGFRMLSYAELREEDEKRPLEERVLPKTPHFADPDEVILAYENGQLDLLQPVVVRLDRMVLYRSEGEPVPEHFTLTTVGRVIFNRRLDDLYSEVEVPEEKRLPFFNYNLGKKDLGWILELSYRQCGHNFVVVLADALKDLGFEWACITGVTLAISDICIPAEKSKIIERARKETERIWEALNRRRITPAEKNEEIIKVWDRANKDLTKAMKLNFDVLNPIWMMANSGARGKIDQVKQLAAMRGLMVGPTGKVLDFPIISNFREGLSVFEYFVSTHGGRKGLVDTALKTADSGYLTRRLVDVAVDVHISELDCGTERGLEVNLDYYGDFGRERVKKQLFGRLLAKDLVDPQTGEVVYPGGTELGHEECERIYEVLKDAPQPRRVTIRSVLTCEELGNGVCAKCFGWDLSNWRLVEVGEPVGVVAAQSIGEPGTQLTLRTFHTGGAGSFVERVTPYQTDVDAEVKDVKRVPSPSGLGFSFQIKLKPKEGKERVIRTQPNTAETTIEVRVKKGEKVKKGSILYVIKRREHVDITRGLPAVESLLEVRSVKDPAPLAEFNGTVKEITKYTPWKVVVRNERLSLERTYEIVLKDDQEPVVKFGQQVKINTPLDPDEIHFTDISGKVVRMYPEDERTYYRIHLVSEDEEKDKVYETPHDNRALLVAQGDYVRKAAKLCEGEFDLKEYHRLVGDLKTQEYLVQTIQEIYESQSVSVNSKYIEIIVRRMFNFVEITDPGGFKGELLPGDKLDRKTFVLLCRHAKERGLKPPKANTILQGISKASLSTESWLAAASFQETTRVLTEAAVEGKKDYLRGLKENVIIGGLIPVGTGHKRDILYRVDAEEGLTMERIEQEEPEDLTSPYSKYKQSFYQEDGGEGF